MIWNTSNAASGHLSNFVLSLWLIQLNREKVTSDHLGTTALARTVACRIEPKKMGNMRIDYYSFSLRVQIGAQFQKMSKNIFGVF